MKVSPLLMVYAAAGAAGLFVAWKLASAATAGAQAVAGAARQVITKDLNPASDQNLAYRAVSSVTAAVTGDDSQTFGGWIYDKLNGDTYAKESARLAAKSQAATAAAQDRYARPPVTSAAPDGLFFTPISFSSASGQASLMDTAGINAFYRADGYGGGLTLR